MMRKKLNFSTGYNNLNLKVDTKLPNGLYSLKFYKKKSIKQAKQIDGIAEGKLNNEPDIFSYMIPNYASKFYINANGDNVQIVHSDLKIGKAADFKNFTIVYE